MGEERTQRESAIAGLARGVSSELLRGVDAGLDDGGARLTRRLDAQVDRLLGRGFALLLTAIAAGWASLAGFMALDRVLPTWTAALLTGGALAALAALVHAVLSRRARDRKEQK